MAPIKNPNASRRQTGTVPKTTSSSSSSSALLTSTATKSSTVKAPSSSSSQKNTEIVAPTRRELNDLNDYLLSVAESTKQSNSTGQHLHLDSTCFEIDNLNFQENQRFCWPVRPLPRRNTSSKEAIAENNQQFVSAPNPTTGCIHPSNYVLNNNSAVVSSIGNSSLAQSSQAIGVVIPTTPNSILHDDNYALNRFHHTNNSVNQQHQSSAENGHINQTISNLDSDLTWEQRLNFIQYFLSLTSKTLNKASDTRAQSVTSIHSASVPNTPTYEELQAKLEASNRNIQNIKDQQQQLLRMQQAAKDHLSEMENIRQQQNRPARFNQNGSAPPVYESVEQVHSDMSSLVNRMKNLTTFIHGQNELSDMLGEDGPEILAEQEALQNKLQELQAQKQDMRNLVSELQEINTSAERSLKNPHSDETLPRVVPIEYERVVPIELVGASLKQNSVHNGHYQQLNSICNGTTSDEITDNVSADMNHEEEAEEAIAETSDLIRQKMDDINAMKNQLKRLKDMMDTVKLIENKSEGKSIQEIADEAEFGIQHQIPFQRDNVQNNQILNPPQPSFTSDENKDESTLAKEAEMTEKVRLLHEMTQDLRDQATSLANERDRLKILKDEMTRRRDAEIVDNTEARETVHIVKDAEKQILKAEFEAKKKEFEKLCERLQSEDDDPDVEHHVEQTIHRDEQKRNNATAPYFTENWRPQNVISSNSSLRGGKQSTNLPISNRGKDSADSGAADVHGIASLEAGSVQSGSSRSFSMPPPMRTINTRETPWRKNSQDNSQSQFELYAPLPPPLPAWNSGYYYSTPYAPQFNPPCHHHVMNTGAGDYFCSHNFHGNAVGQAAVAAANVQPNSNQQSVVPSNDPVLLQQFIQTQQMLINSVCQCNQLLWHQQREINNLNNAVVLLQERLLNLANPELATLNTNRSESVPPSCVTVANNLYTSAHRAQSEQPHQPFQTVQQSLSSPGRHQYQAYNYANSYQHQHRRNINNIHHQGQQSTMSSNSAAFNFSTEQNQSVLCSQLPPVVPHIHSYNNVPQSPQTSSFLNNDVPQSANIHQQHPAPPIFMHHHNNTITPSDVNAVAANLQQQQHHTNNNSNLLTSQQNCLNSPSANASQSSVTNNQVPVQNNASNAAAASALNNQVPPGNRANNYWDNFRSYSRQNLLSSNSCKSNEEQQQQISSLPFGVNGGANITLSGVRNIHQANAAGNLSSNSNNLTPPTFDNKYVHTFRNQFTNNIVTEHQPEHLLNQVPTQSAVVHSLPPPAAAVTHFGVNTVQQPHSLLINQATQSENINLNNEMFTFNNNSSNNNDNSNNNVAAIFGSTDFRNMNFNFGANEFRKKMPFKPSCNTKRIRHSQSMTNDIIQPNRGSISSQISSSGFVDDGVDDTTATASSMNRNASLDEGDQHVFLTDCNDDDDTNGDASGYSETSDEIKKNLLVNALRNDKFTSKFFETLKEDVYREVYDILQATESHPQYLVQLFKELQLVPTTDPIRNIVMQAMHDIYKRSCIGETESNDQCTNNLSDTNDATASNSEHLAESENQPESNQENELMNILLNSTELRRLAYKIMFDCDRTPPPEEDRESKFGAKCNLSFSSPGSSPKPAMEIYRPDYDLVNHIMTIIRSTIQSQKIDEDVMIRTAKLTISSLERLSSTLGNNTLQIDPLLISPKELYRKMKTFDRRDRDGFLERYELYLQTMFVMKLVNDDANNVNLASKKPPITTSSMLATTLSLNSADVENLRRNAFVSKSNIIGSGGFGLELNCNKKSERQVEPSGQTEISNETTTSTKSKSTLDEHKQPQQKNRSRTRRPKSNIITPAVNLLFSNNDTNVANTFTSPSTSGNNIMNEDLAEADQICSSSTNLISETPTAGFLTNDKQKQGENITSNENKEKQTGDKEGRIKEKKSDESSTNQEAEAENFETYTLFRKTSSESSNIDLVEYSGGGGVIVCSSDIHVGVLSDAQPIMSDEACAVIYQTNSNSSVISSNISSSFLPITDPKQRNGAP